MKTTILITTLIIFASCSKQKRVTIEVNKPIYSTYETHKHIYQYERGDSTIHVYKTDKGIKEIPILTSEWNLRINR